MDALRLADVAARLVAWHNRHPLARRISLTDVSSIGVVALPYALPDEGGVPLKPLYDALWLYNLPAAPLHRWMARHGHATLPDIEGWPWRQIDADLTLSQQADAQGLTGRALRQVLTATLSRDGLHVRVLLDGHPDAADVPAADAGGSRFQRGLARLRALRRPTAGPAVFGTRLWQPARAAALAAALAGAAAGVAGMLVAATVRDHGEAEPTAVVAQAPHPAASEVHAAAIADIHATPDRVAEAPSVPAPVQTDHVSAEASTEAAIDTTQEHEPTHEPDAAPDTRVAQAEAHRADASPSHPATSPAAERPVDVPIRVLSRADGAPLVSLRPMLSEDAKRGARVATESVRLADAPAPSAVPSGRMYAIATLPARTRDDAMAERLALRGLQAASDTPMPTQLDVMPASNRWRVVWWPHPDRSAAEALLLQARARGLKAELIAF